MNKDVNVKDVDAELTEEEKKEHGRKLKLILLIILVSFVGILFVATYLRWKAEIDDKHRIIYYKQDGYKIDSLVDFYGADVDLDISDDEALILYCNKDYGKNCMTVDLNNTMENIYRDPIIIVNVVIVLDLLFVYLLIKDKFMKDIKKLIIGIVIMVYGLSLAFVQTYKIADYYIFANNNFKTTATIYKKVVTQNKKSFQPIVKYKINDKEYTEYLDTRIKGKIEDKVGEEINIHYYKKDKNVIVSKKNVLWRIAPIVLGILIVIESIMYLPKKRKIVEEKKNTEENKDNTK